MGILIPAIFFGMFFILFPFILFDWEMILIDSNEVKFCKKLKKSSFKWKEIQILTLQYERNETKYEDMEGIDRETLSRVIFIKVKTLDEKIHRMKVKISPMLMNISRGKKHDKYILKYLENIKDQIIIEPITKRSKVGKILIEYKWIIQSPHNKLVFEEEIYH